MTKTTELESLKEKLVTQKRVLSKLNVERKKKLTEFQSTKAALLSIMQRCGMTRCVDEESKLLFEIKPKPSKSGHSTIKKLLQYLGEANDEDKDLAAIEKIKLWSKIIHSRDAEDLKLYIKSMPRKSEAKVNCSFKKTH